MNFVVSKQVNLGQGRHGQFLAGKASKLVVAAATAVAAAFCSVKSRQGLGLWGLTSRSDPAGKIDYVIDFLNPMSKSEVNPKIPLVPHLKIFFHLHSISMTTWCVQ